MNESVAKVHVRRGNHALVQLDGRKFPGLLMQGDSLKQVQDAVDELMELRGHDEALQEVAEAIKALSESYESMMREANLPLPY